MMPSSYSSPVLNRALDSASTWSRTASRMDRSASSSKGRPAEEAEARLSSDMTPASCSGPITADREAGQVNRNRGS
jgi:hypothetical protein